MLSSVGQARVDQLQESPDNPRTSFDPRALEELADSIREQGILVPLLVRPAEDNGHFVIIDGARRYRAAAQAGLAEVPIVIHEQAPADSLETALVANLQRADVHPMDEARAFGACVGPRRDLDQVVSLASRLAKPKGYVWDRLKLLDLIPDAQQLLHANRLTLPHATLLARLTGDQQARAIDPNDGGLFTHEASLGFEGDDGEDVDAFGAAIDRWAGLKAVSVRELEAWIATHVRFNPHVAAAAAPLDFGPVSERVTEAALAPGRGKKVVSITYDHFVKPEAKSDEGERTYCAASWKRADGRDARSPRCDRSVLGVVVVGPCYGEAFPVCLHKDCDVHWAEERKAKDHAAQATTDGQAGRTARDDRENQKWKAVQAREERAREAWVAAIPALEAATVAAVKKAKPMALAPLLTGVAPAVVKLLGPAKTADDVVRHQALARLLGIIRSEYWGPREFPKTAKPYGIDVPAILKAAAKPAAAAPAKKVGKKR